MKISLAIDIVSNNEPTSVVSGNGLAPNRQKAPIWTNNVNPDLCCCVQRPIALLDHKFLTLNVS